MSSHEDLIKIFEYALQQEDTGKSFFQNSLQRMEWEQPSAPLSD
jgi:hypothetical protein